MHADMKCAIFSTAAPSFYLLLLALVFVENSSGCAVPLGMQNGRISDQQLSASSHHSIDTLVQFGRLNNSEPYGWCPDQSSTWYPDQEGGPYYDQYLQVKFHRPLRIRFIVTQGRETSQQLYLKAFRVNYTVFKSRWKEAIDYHTGEKTFPGAHDVAIVSNRNSFIPELVADTIRIIPKIYPVNQVCLRLELYGCELDDQGLTSYSMLQGNVLGGKYNLIDFSYSGVTHGSTLSSGQGVLTDHKLASDNYADNNGRGWIGWQRKKSSNPYITFTFLKPRLFQKVTFHCNIRMRAKVALFSAVSVKLSLDGTSNATLVNYEPPKVDSAFGWRSYNVTVDLCGNLAKFVRIDFQYRASPAQWILLSEVTFVTDPISSQDVPTTTTTTTTPTTAAVVTEPLPPPMSASLIALAVSGIIIILVLLVAIACLIWKLRKNRRSHSNQMQPGSPGADDGIEVQNPQDNEYTRELNGHVYMELQFKDGSPYQSLNSLIVDPPAASGDDVGDGGYEIAP